MAFLVWQVGEIMEENGVSIFSILQNPIKNRNDDQFVIITDKCDVANVKKACAGLEATDWCMGETFYMPCL